MKACVAIFLTLFVAGRALSQEGELDPSFAGAGSFTFSIPGSTYLSAADVAIQPDGRIVVVATATLLDGSDHFALMRFLADGTPDMEFGDGGVVLSDGGGLNDDAHGLALQPDGSIVVAGTRAASPQGMGSVLVIRYDATGQPDATFGDNGVVVTDLPTGWSAAANALLLAPNGKLIVGGSADLLGGDTQALILRYLTTGALDDTFGDGDGYAKYGLGFMGAGYFREQLFGLSFTEGGNIVGVGGCLIPTAPGSSAFRMKVHSDGSVDGFGNSYFSWTDGPNWANNVTRTPDGDYIAVGRGAGDGSQMTYLRLDENGSSEESGALLMLDDGPHASVGFDAAVTDDGMIYLAGSIDRDGGHHFGLERMDAFCGEDPVFGVNGHLTTPMGTDGQAEAHAIALQPDGKVILAGFAVSDGRTELALARYLTEATTDVQEASALAPDMNVYPNPATDHITVEYVLEDARPVSLELLDASGRVVDQPIGRTMRTAGPQRETITFSQALVPGVYLLRLSDDERTRMARVIVR